jgi:O-antigen/teichoic acid export membrane protein
MGGDARAAAAARCAPLTPAARPTRRRAGVRPYDRAVDPTVSDVSAEGDGGSKRTERDGVLRNATFGFLAQVSTSVFTAVLTLYLVRALDPSGFGVFALALTIAGICLLLADAGLSQSTARFIAERRENPAAIARLLSDALRLKLVLGGVVALALVALAEPIADAYGQPGLTWALRGIAIAVFANALLLLYLQAFIATGRLRSSLRVIFLESAMETTASITLVVLGAGATGAAFGRAIGYGFGALIAVLLVRSLYGNLALRLRGADSGRARELLTYAGPLFVTHSAYILYSSVDVLLIGALLDAVAVGLFSAPMRLMVMLGLVGIAVSNAVSPRLALDESGHRDVASFRAALRWLMIFQAALVAPVVVWAQPIIVLLLGPEYRESADVLRLLAPFLFLAGISPLISNGVDYLGRAASRIPIVLGALLINVLIDVTLIPTIGVEAGAIGTSVAYMVYVPGHMWLCRQVIDVPLRPLAATLARALAAAAAMAAVLLAVGTRELSASEWIFGALGATTAFCVVLVASREVSRAELRASVASVRLRARGLAARTSTGD